MKNLEEFVNTVVKIEPVPNGGFGHYPFQMFCEDQNSEYSMHALCHSRIAPCIQQWTKCVDEGCNRIYISLDFPAKGDMLHDFVAVISYEEKQTDAFAIPYNPETGEKYARVDKSEHLDGIIQMFSENKPQPKIMEASV